MKSMQFEIVNKDESITICDVIATYHDDDTNKDYIVYTDKSYDEDHRLKIYSSLYKEENNSIKLIEITDINDKKISLELIKELINDISNNIVII